MSLLETEGLVLKTYNLAEADRIVVFLTHGHGLVRGVAKGAKRLKSKFGSSLEPYTVVKLAYIQKEGVELVSIQHVELVQSYFAFASEAGFQHRFAYLMDLLTAIIAPNDPSDDLYRMVKACFNAAAETPDSLDRVGLYFEVWLLRLGGYLPDWNRCEHCRRLFDSNEVACLQVNFQLQCLSCTKARTSSVVSPAARDLLGSIQKLSPLRFAQSASNIQNEIHDLSPILRRIFATATGRDVMVGRDRTTAN